ncbi:hypothetical protein JXO52_07430 [bacterium]|nr:hypothetical protein [bacterium]
MKKRFQSVGVVMVLCVFPVQAQVIEEMNDSSRMGSWNNVLSDLEYGMQAAKERHFPDRAIDSPANDAPDCFSLTAPDTGDELTLPLSPDLTGSVAVIDGTGPDIMFNYTISNSGDVGASNFHVYIVLSVNTTISTSDILVGDYVHSIAGAHSTTYTSVTVDVGDAAPGTYYLGIVVDATGLITESNENNNTGYDNSPQVTVPAWRDLSGMVTVTDDAGPDIRWEYTLINTGNASADNFHTRFLLSTDETISVAEDILIYDLTRSLDAGSTVESWVTASFLLTAPGTYFLGVVVDATSVIPESDENNNTNYDAVTQVVIDPLPDLKVRNLSLSAIEKNSLELTFSCEILNQGNVSVDLTDAHLSAYLSLDQTISREDDYFFADAAFLRGVHLSPGQTYSLGTRTFPYEGPIPGIPEGTYYFGVYVDPNDAVEESRESNNSASDTDPRVPVPAALPDLVWGGPDIIHAGDKVTLQAFIRNYGWADAVGPFSYRVYLSSDEQIDGGDYLITEQTITQTLHPLQSTLSNPAPFSIKDVPAGTYHSLWQLDSGDQIPELFENNTQTGETIDVVHLHLTSPSVGDVWVKGNPYTISWTWEGDVRPVSLNLYRAYTNGATHISTITQSTANTGTYVYTPPAALSDGSNYQISIVETGSGSEPGRTQDWSDSFTIQTTAPPTPKPDLVIQSIGVLDGTGPEIRYQATAKNQGDAAAGESTVKFYLSTDTQITSSDHYIDSWTVSGSLAAGSSRASGERTVTVSGVADGEYYLGAIADANGQVNESSEGNNSGHAASPKVIIPKSTERFWADLDGDGDVDIADVQMVAGRWGCCAGDGNYLAICDVDGDGDIDVVDVQMVAGLWGTSV